MSLPQAAKVLFTPFKQFHRDRCAFAAVSEPDMHNSMRVVKSQVSLLRLVRMPPWVSWVVGDEMIGIRVSGIGVDGVGNRH